MTNTSRIIFDTIYGKPLLRPVTPPGKFFYFKGALNEMKNLNNILLFEKSSYHGQADPALQTPVRYSTAAARVGKTP
jgi:hypothetical protein